MVELRGVSKVYARAAGGRVEALVGVSCAVKAGELAVILGPAGAGKTTLLHLLSGLEGPTRGVVLVDDLDVGALGARALARLRRSLGVVSQPGRLLGDRTAIGNVTVVLRALGAGRAEAQEQAIRALDEAGLQTVRNALPHELAESERCRLLLARALAGRPRVLLADEPAAMLPAVVPEIVALIGAARARGATCLIATQSPALAKALDGRILRLADGRLAPEGEPG